jgi:hypothetical protein
VLFDKIQTVQPGAHRQARAAAHDPVARPQQLADMPCGAERIRRRRGVISTLHAGCHFYLAPTQAPGDANPVALPESLSYET